jgi:hypothetical protein
LLPDLASSSRGIFHIAYADKCYITKKQLFRQYSAEATCCSKRPKSTAVFIVKPRDMEDEKLWGRMVKSDDMDDQGRGIWTKKWYAGSKAEASHLR